MASTETEKARYQRYRQERRDAGKCPRCGGERQRDGIVCQICVDEELTRRKIKRMLRLCTTCGTRSTYSVVLGEDPRTCTNCLAKRSIKRNQLKAKGLCPCGNPIKEGSLANCETCLKRQAINAKKYRAKKRFKKS